MRSYQDMVYSTAYRLLASHAEAQDISQVVFLKAYDRFEEICDSPRVGGWLKTVARNLSLNHLTRHRNRRTLFSEFARDGSEDRDDFEANIEDAAALPSDNTDVKDQRAILEAALDGLPASQRAAIVLYHFEDMPYQEIATKLKVSLSKVKTDIMRGRQTLKARLDDRKNEFAL